MGRNEQKILNNKANCNVGIQKRLKTWKKEYANPPISIVTSDMLMALTKMQRGNDCKTYVLFLKVRSTVRWKVRVKDIIHQANNSQGGASSNTSHKQDRFT